jgi:hypothetical protein
MSRRPDDGFQRAVRELVTQLVERDVVEQHKLPTEDPEVRRAWEMRAGSNLEVLDPATLPELPVSPNRVAIGFAGLPLGLLAFGSAGSRPFRPRNPRSPDSFRVRSIRVETGPFRAVPSHL